MSNDETTVVSNGSSYSWARTFRDIGVHAINTGQFPFFCMFIVSLVFLIRLPPETLSEISLEILKHFKEYIISGYVLFIVTLLCVAFYISAINKRHKTQVGKLNAIINELKEDLRISTTSSGGAS